jgi:hypothetical protein
LELNGVLQQSKELVAAGIPVLHYYSMGKAENIKAIAKEDFLNLRSQKPIVLIQL